MSSSLRGSLGVDTLDHCCTTTSFVQCDAPHQQHTTLYQMTVLPADTGSEVVFTTFHHLRMKSEQRSTTSSSSLNTHKAGCWVLTCLAHCCNANSSVALFTSTTVAHYTISHAQYLRLNVVMTHHRPHTVPNVSPCSITSVMAQYNVLECDCILRTEKQKIRRTITRNYFDKLYLMQ